MRFTALLLGMAIPAEAVPGGTTLPCAEESCQMALWDATLSRAPDGSLRLAAPLGTVRLFGVEDNRRRNLTDLLHKPLTPVELRLILSQPTFVREVTDGGMEAVALIVGPGVEAAAPEPGLGYLGVAADEATRDPAHTTPYTKPQVEIAIRAQSAEIDAASE